MADKEARLEESQGAKAGNWLLANARTLQPTVMASGHIPGEDEHVCWGFGSRRSGECVPLGIPARSVQDQQRRGLSDRRVLCVLAPCPHKVVP